MAELNNLVEELEEECSFPHVGFGKHEIRQHVLDVLNEIRRSVRKRYDYTKVIQLHNHIMI